uniref:Cytochrome c-type protein n=1 Tax=Rhodopseudomonas palustris (strain BisA53) TaxID=316055 RepID=Q07J15_RHOP5
MNIRWLRSRWSLVAVALVAAAAGVVAWGGVNTAMEATNSLEFCTSCHVMRDNVFQEYKKTVHYTNRSGVRAICSDCHVPRDWIHKVERKLTATKELYHWALGSIDTREKFEAKRHELARHEWDRMRANGSRECRNCHSFEAMDFHKQNAKSAKAMQEAMKAGKTCIDCHKGIAHTLPDVAAGHRAAFAALQTEAAKLAPAVGTTVYAIGSVPFTLDGESEPGGDIAATTAATVRGIASDRLDLELIGWQREGSPELMYQRQGARIAAATLTEAAVARAESLETVTDEDTGTEWIRARLQVSAAPGRFVTSLAPLWGLGAKIHDDNCTLCHVLKPPGFATANDWIGHLNAMKRYTPLDSEEVALLRSYLQNHAKP